jgi:uncharacterized phiE125 gp8 family phage protein
MVESTRPTRTVAPAGLPITLAEVREAVRGLDTGDDVMLDRLMGAAVAHADGYSGTLGRCLLTQTWAMRFDDWAWVYRLPFPDVQSVTVTYLDTAGATQTVAGSDYELIRDDNGTSIRFRGAFSQPGLKDDEAFPVTVTMVAGYGVAADVPADIRTYLIALTAHWYDGHEGEPPQAVIVHKHRWTAL